MAETLTELVARISTDATELKRGLSEGEKATEASSKKMSESLKKVGVAMAASGAAITAALGLMGKAAIDEEINIKRLATTINNSGTAYDKVKDSLEAVIATTQRKTGVADDEQRNILNRLILVTNDYGKALELLPTVLDLAAAGEMDATTAATYLGKAFLELEDGAEEVSVRFGQASLQFKSMEDIQNRVTGAAENLANPLSVLKASMGDVAESIGANLIPLVKDAIDKIVDITIKIQDWVKEHPVLARVLTLVALGLGGVLTVVGGLILVMPVITSLVAAFGVVFHAALGPIGLISLAIMGLITVGILLWKNWDKIMSFLQTKTGVVVGVILATLLPFIGVPLLIIANWSKVKIAFLTILDTMLGALEKFVGWIPGIGNKIKSARDAISSMIDREKIKRDIQDTERNLKELTKTVQAEFDKQASEIQASFDIQRQESKKAYDAAVVAINKEYGIGEAAKEVSKTKIETAKRATQALKESYEREKDAAKDRYDFEMSRIQDIRDERLKNLNIETDATVNALQDQIDAIDNQTSREELAITRAEETSRLAELEGAYASAKTAADKAKAKEEWDKYVATVARNELLRTRNEEKDALRDRIEEARELAKERKDQIKEETDAALASLKEKYNAEITNYNNLAIEADRDLDAELKRIETDRLAKIAAEQAKLNAELSRLANAEKAEIQFYANQLTAANKQVADINVAYDALTKRYDIEIVTHQITVSGRGGGGAARGGGGKTAATAPPTATEIAPPGLLSPNYTQKDYQSDIDLMRANLTENQKDILGLASGGIVTQPTLAMVGESGAEAIIPLNETGGMGGVTINFTQPVFFDREDTMNRFVDMISKGIDRKQRLRFGGAYGGS